MKRAHAVPATRFLSAAVCGWLATAFGAEAAETRHLLGITDPNSGTTATKQILRETFAYDPAVRKKAEALKKVAEGAMQMDAVVVTEDKHSNPSFNSYVARQRQLIVAKKPSLARGAEIPGLPGVGVTPYVEPIPFGTPIARWSLIKLPW